MFLKINDLTCALSVNLLLIKYQLWLSQEAMGPMLNCFCHPFQIQSSILSSKKRIRNENFSTKMAKVGHFQKFRDKYREKKEHAHAQHFI